MTRTQTRHLTRQRHQAVRDLAHININLLVNTLTEHAGGYPTGSDEPPVTGGGAHMVIDGERIPATTVEITALSDDKAEAALARFQQLLRRVESDCAELAKIHDFWTGTTHDTPGQVDNTDGCDVCHKAGGWEPVHRKNTTVGGLLDQPVSLGRWAYDFARKLGRLPSKDETLAHLEGRRIRVHHG